MQAVAHFKQLVELFTDHQHRAARIAQGQHRAANLRGCAHVHAPGGLRDDEQAGLGVDFPPHNEFLQIAARERARCRIRPAGLDAEALHDAPGLRVELAQLQPAAQKPGQGNRFLAGEQQVLRQAQRRYRAAPQALLRHKVQAELAPRARVQGRDIVLSHGDAARTGAAVFAR